MAFSIFLQFIDLWPLFTPVSFPLIWSFYCSCCDEGRKKIGNFVCSAPVVFVPICQVKTCFQLSANLICQTISSWAQLVNIRTVWEFGFMWPIFPYKHTLNIKYPNHLMDFLSIPAGAVPKPGRARTNCTIPLTFPPRVVFTLEALDASSWSVIFVLPALNPPPCVGLPDTRCGKINARRQGIGCKKIKMERCELLCIVKVKTTRGGNWYVYFPSYNFNTANSCSEYPKISSTLLISYFTSFLLTSNTPRYFLEALRYTRHIVFRRLLSRIIAK